MAKVDYINMAITQRCNLACRHCLRGNARNKVMEDSTIYNIFKDLDNLPYLNITGGEVLLHPDKLATVADAILKNKTFVGRIGLVTNGTIWSTSTEDAIKKLNRNHAVLMSISSDPFHSEEKTRLKRHDFTDDILRFCEKNNIRLLHQGLSNGIIYQIGRAKLLTDQTLPELRIVGRAYKKYNLQPYPTTSKEEALKNLLGIRSPFGFAMVNVDGAVGGYEEEWSYYDNPDNILFNVNDMTFAKFIESQQEQ